MKKGLFTIFFMILITVVFISTLAFVNEYSQPQIQRNLKIDQYKSILYAFDIFPPNVRETDLAPTSTTNNIPWSEPAILENMQQQITSFKLPVLPDQRALLKGSYLAPGDSVEIFRRVDASGKTVAFGFPLKGKGLWGTITAFGVISADLQKMIGIDFTDQVETPGLGARILETEFKYFFRQLDLRQLPQTTEPVILMVRQKSKSNVEESTSSLQAITGATQTCNGVLAMLNTDLRFYLAILKANLNETD